MAVSTQQRRPRNNGDTVFHWPYLFIIPLAVAAVTISWHASRSLNWSWGYSGRVEQLLDRRTYSLEQQLRELRERVDALETARARSSQ